MGLDALKYDTIGRLLNHGGPIRPRLDLGDDQAWRDRAACLGMDHLFFIDRGASAQPAKRICAACPVINECLDYALRTSAREGIWGGLSERERRKVKQQRRREAS